MKHPILYRIGFYSCFILLTIGFILQLTLMDGAPFKSSDMRDAYAYGCLFASKPLNDQLILKCSKNADMFKETMDDIDKQMEVLDAKRK